MAFLRRKNNTYQCSNCFMRLELVENCPFCGEFFNNYEDIILENYKNLTYSQNSGIIYTESEGKNTNDDEF